MTSRSPIPNLLLVLLVAGLAACARHQEYRTEKSLCVVTTAEPSLADERHALQRIRTPQGNEYFLGFVEFDDQGRLWERDQMNFLLNTLTDINTREDLLMVVFAHGWKHSAKPNDGNIQTFRQVLAGLSNEEVRLSRRTGEPPRRIVGVYLGWRGASVTVPILENLTFWERKEIAHKVGRGQVTEVLSRLDQIRRDRDSIVQGGSRTRLVVIGHSFGGAVVNSSVSQILESRFVETKDKAGSQGDVAGFGNLVVMINPAFEALQFASLSDMAAARGWYSQSQLPVVLILTSKADWATRFAFPFGRFFSTLFENTRDVKRTNLGIGGDKSEAINERKANWVTVGHFKPYLTHELYRPTAQVAAVGTTETAASSVSAFLRASADWAHDDKNNEIRFGTITLKRSQTSVGRNPYLNVSVSGDLIKDHNDLDEPPIIEFIKRIILISSQSPQQAKLTR